MSCRTLKYASAVLLATSVACATGLSERRYVRPGLDTLALERVDVVVSVATPVETDDQLDVEGFLPPNRTSLLFDRAESKEGTADLAASAAAHLRGLGFEVNVLSSSTSLSRDATLASALELPSQADAVLVLRALPVDRFVVHTKLGTRVEARAGGGPGRETVTEWKSERRNGRLFVGQAFLYDKKSGLRLWTKQAPDFPDGGRIVAGGAFLGYGTVLEADETTTKEALSKRASGSFVDAILGDFPKANAASGATGDRMAVLGTSGDVALQEFLDHPYFAFEVSAGYGAETVDVDLSFADQSIPSLGSAETLPSGLFKLVPRASYWSAGGTSWSIALPLGLAPASFSRTYYIDGVDGAPDQVAPLSSGGLTSVGLVPELGVLIPLSSDATAFFIPRGGALMEVWLLDVTPASVAPDTDRVRLGVVGGADVLYRPSPKGALFLRTGADLRAGFDLSGGFFAGFAAALGVGILL